jgi:beta-lactamase class C
LGITRSSIETINFFNLHGLGGIARVKVPIMKPSVIRILVAFGFALLVVASPARAADTTDVGIKTAVDEPVRQLMARQGIPGMAIGIVRDNDSFVFNYGVASKQSKLPVTDKTIFDIGSISKTFTALLAALAEAKGFISLNEKVEKYLPEVTDTPFGSLTLENLATHAIGGMGLQFPGEVTSVDTMFAFYGAWRPQFVENDARYQYRTYANPPIGALGYIVSRRWNEDFGSLMKREVFRPFGLTSTYFEVPSGATSDYAQGYTAKDEATPTNQGMLDRQMYGVKSTAADLLKVLRANMHFQELPQDLKIAVQKTHVRYLRRGTMAQDMIWEQYDLPVDLETLKSGNSFDAIKPTRVARISPPLPPTDDALFNKSGSTNGFSAYVVFIPSKNLGVVFLANKWIPNEERVETVYKILSKIAPN